MAIKEIFLPSTSGKEHVCFRIPDNEQVEGLDGAGIYFRREGVEGAFDIDVGLGIGGVNAVKSFASILKSWLSHGDYIREILEINNKHGSIYIEINSNDKNLIMGPGKSSLEFIIESGTKFCCKFRFVMDVTCVDIFFEGYDEFFKDL